MAIKQITEGTFNIQFKAIPDKTVLKKLDPIFDYIIYADITDISGETRSATYHVSAGYNSLVLNVKIKERIPIDSTLELYISTENLAGQFVPSYKNCCYKIIASKPTYKKKILGTTRSIYYE